MIIGREVRGAHAITAVDHPQSFWAGVERTAGFRLNTDQRRTLTTAIDSTAPADDWSYQIRESRRAAWTATERGGFIVNRPAWDGNA